MLRTALKLNDSSLALVSTGTQANTSENAERQPSLSRTGVDAPLGALSGSESSLPRVCRPGHISRFAGPLDPAGPASRMPKLNDGGPGPRTRNGDEIWINRMLEPTLEANHHEREEAPQRPVSPLWRFAEHR